MSNVTSTTLLYNLAGLMLWLPAGLYLFRLWFESPQKLWQRFKATRVAQKLIEAGQDPDYSDFVTGYLLSGYLVFNIVMWQICVELVRFVGRHWL